jgi:hypothetical protein
VASTRDCRATRLVGFATDKAEDDTDIVATTICRVFGFPAAKVISERNRIRGR